MITYNFNLKVANLEDASPRQTQHYATQFISYYIGQKQAVSKDFITARVRCLIYRYIKDWTGGISYLSKSMVHSKANGQ